MSEKLPVPVSVCTVCHAYSRNHSLINYTCGSMINGKRCKGMWGSALKSEMWDECQVCNATNNTCEACNGEGWVYTKK